MATKVQLDRLNTDWEAAKTLAPAHRADAGIEAIIRFINSAESEYEGVPSGIPGTPSVTSSTMQMIPEGQKVEGPAAFLGVNYEEFKPETYKSVFVRTQDGQGGEANSVFDSGVFVDDLNRATEFLNMFQGQKFELSSYHNYCSDLAKLEGSQTKEAT